jgi:DNA-binding NarL/FixJ family response regulator
MFGKITEAYLEVTSHAKRTLHHTTNLDDALNVLKTEDIALVLLDNRLPPGNDFRGSLQRLEAVIKAQPIVLLSGENVKGLGERPIDQMIKCFILKDDFGPNSLETVISDFVEY